MGFTCAPQHGPTICHRFYAGYKDGDLSPFLNAGANGNYTPSDLNTEI